MPTNTSPFGIHQPLAIKPQAFQSPLDLPESRSGDIEVSHHIIPAGERMPIIGFRQALMRGITPTSAISKKPTRIHQLKSKKNGMWMTDMPEELFQIAEMITVVSPCKRVLVGGLGLGIVATLMRDRPGVTDVTVIEIDEDVIHCCAVDRVNLLQGDIHQQLKILPEHDFYLLDTWQGTNEGTWWTEVMPMRRTIRNRFKDRPAIHAWAEDIMIGQVAAALANKDKRFWFYAGLPPMSPKEAMRFCWSVGLPDWERKYGAIVDKNMREFSGRKKAARKMKAA